MKTFLDALYGDLPENAWFYLWTLAPDNTKATFWFNETDEAAAVAGGLGDVNCYYTIAWGTHRGPSFRRMEYGETAGIVGLVSDIDLRGPSKPLSPPTEADAMSLIEMFPLRPTACMHSGHGLQCLWLFREPWAFDNDDERARAAHLSKCWAYTLSSIASKVSYELDAVHDLTRVMRVPGTWNMKDPERPVLTELRWLEDDTRYNPGDFEEFLVDIPTVSAPALPQIDLSSGFPVARHEAMLANNPDYAATWRHERKLPRDNSCSGYDMALASMAVRADWTDDEVAAMLREHQRMYGNKPAKLSDTRYYAKTIAAAHKGHQEQSARFKADEVLEDPDEDRDKQIHALAVRLEIPLTNIQRVSGDPAQVRFWIGGKCAEVPATSLNTQNVFLQQMISAANYYPRPVEKKEQPGWREMVNIMLRVAEPVDAGEEATVDGEFRDMVSGFLEGRGIPDCPEGELLERDGPFRRGGQVWFRLEHLAQYVRLFDPRLSRRVLAQRLKTMGAVKKHHKMRGRETGTATTCRFYGLADDAMRIPFTVENEAISSLG